jgi:hypothetical protein
MLNRSQITDGEDDLQIWRVAANMFGTDWGVPCFSSVVRQMPGYKWKVARPAYTRSWRPPAEVNPPPKCRRGLQTKRFQFWVQLPVIHPTEGQLLVGIIPHQKQIHLCYHVKAFCRDITPVSVSTSLLQYTKTCFPFPAMRLERRSGSV